MQAYWQTEEIDKATSVLERGLSFAAERGIVQPFIDEGPELARILYRARALGVDHPFIGKLLAAFPLDQQSRAAAETQSHSVGALSAREVKVLNIALSGAVQQRSGCHALPVGPDGEVVHLEHLRETRCLEPNAGNRKGSTARDPSRVKLPYLVSCFPASPARNWTKVRSRLPPHRLCSLQRNLMNSRPNPMLHHRSGAGGPSLVSVAGGATAFLPHGR